ncbi:hypothetical protein N7495_008161 [Penicillium taxi]|uniref:uncharacterized protein n=1 Tax=Penicillium taxi TaxID=168475 RepID=UPI0025455DBC|nr:uncharacterized protein N7495_008161 [Penicillium taxi]KAJ5888120.1 hypothetical protein N7495_008161 [Penicillium taxi]
MTAPALVDPTKQAEYPIVLGERLAKADSSRLVNVNYNYKTKSATSRQRSIITRSSPSHDLYNLSVTDKAPNADHTLAYSYEGCEDPASEGNYILVFDPDRKVFVLDTVSTKYNFNLRSAPGKTEKQVIEQYEQLSLGTHEYEHTSGEDRNAVSGASEDEGTADDNNPYDFRHFLRKEGAEDVKPASGHSTPEPVYTSKANTPIIPATKPATKPIARPRKQANPLRETKRPAKPPARADPPKPTTEIPAEPTVRADPLELEQRRRSPSAGASQKSISSPGSNIIIDGDLIIDMGSPPPSRPFRVNPAHFSSNHTPDDREEDDGDEELEEFRLPSPAGNNKAPPPILEADDVEDDDALAAEMEAAFEESAREEEQARNQQYGQNHYNVPSDDESEVSEEE